MNPKQVARFTLEDKVVRLKDTLLEKQDQI